MGLIYVNPEGPERQPGSARARRSDIRETFGRMAMNDEETVALIAGGHTFGKTHGAGDRVARRRRSPRPAASRTQGFGWKSKLRHRQGRATRSPSGLEVTWTTTPTQVEQQLLREPVRLRVGADEEPGRRAPVGRQERAGAIDPGRARSSRRSIVPTMLTTDLVAALRPGLREDLAALPREPGPVRRRLRPRLVQADAPRHGPASRATSAR